MVKIISKLLPILCVWFTEVHCMNSMDPRWDPRVWPETFVDDDKPFIELTCGAYLKSKERLSWHKEGDTKKNSLSTITQPDDGYRMLKLLWPLALLDKEKVYCLKRNKTDTRSKSVLITSEKNNYPDITAKERGPWLMPAAFVANGKRFELTCYAYLQKGNELSCYQIKDKSVFTKLGMIQQENDNSYVKITLQKTLEPSDNGSVIYCNACTEIKQKLKTYNSTFIPITFEKQIEALEPYVTVEPSTDVVFFDENDALEFVCGGSESDNARRLTWYLETPGLCQVTPPDQYFYKSANENRLSLRMDVLDHKKRLYCAQELELPEGKETREVVRSRTITLLHREQCDTKDRPRVVPTTFVDKHKSCIQITCYAFLKPGQLLSWFQSAELNKSAGSLLRMVQLQDHGTQEGEWTVLTLNKTLEPSDNRSEIYCSQQSVRADGRFSDEFNQTERIPITLNRDIPCLERPFIRVEPNNASVYFDVNTTLRLTCGGSKPVDGRTYTWFKKESESSFTVLGDQKYDASTNLNVLYLSLNESHHLNELFCAQGFISYIRHTGGLLHVKSYGELVVSNITTLIQQEHDEEKQDLAPPTCPGNTHLLLSVATPLALLTLAAAAAACWAMRRRRAAPLAPSAPAPHAPAPPTTAPRDNTDDIYGDYANVSRMLQASPQVTYAELELPGSAVAARAPPAPDQALYAEVARVPPQEAYAALDLPKAARAPPAPEPSLYAEIDRGYKR